MRSTLNVIPLNPQQNALRASHGASKRAAFAVRTTTAFRAMLDAPQSPAALALLRLMRADVSNGDLTGYVTWSLDEVYDTIVIRQWPSRQLLDRMPFPVNKLTPTDRSLRFAAHITSKTATLGIANDPDPGLKDKLGRMIG